MAEQFDSDSDGKLLLLPGARRTMWVSMVGTISQPPGTGDKGFDFGVLRYPELNNPVWYASEDDLDVIFEKRVIDHARKARLVTIGSSPLFPDYHVKVDLDLLFGKHAAVLGSTGSGKSCTVTALIKAVLGNQSGHGMPNANFVIFDTNAEYEAAFTREAGDDKDFLAQRLVISNEEDTASGFWVPHWFMNGRDFTAFFRPSEGAHVLVQPK